MECQLKPYHLSVTDVTEDLISEYLRSHPEFFTLNADLLEYLEVPHVCGKAISLIERQVLVLEKNQRLQQEMNETLLLAKKNMLLIEATKNLTLRILKSTSLNAIMDALHESLHYDFKIDLIRIGLAGHFAFSNNAIVNLYKRDQMPLLKDILKGNKITARRLSKEILYGLFKESAVDAKSTILIPLGRQGILGYIALGSRNPKYFQKEIDILFLDHIGKILAQRLPYYEENISCAAG